MATDDDELDLDLVRPERLKKDPIVILRAPEGYLDMSELRALTDASIAKAKGHKEQRHAETAEKIVAALMARSRREASKGKHSAIVMGLRSHRDYGPLSSTAPALVQLTGVARQVVDILQNRTPRIPVKVEKDERQSSTSYWMLVITW